jgi:AraC-like DNA-binding protein/ligand-binding sensor protein
MPGALFRKTEALLRQYCHATGVQGILFNDRFEVAGSVPETWTCKEYYCRNQNECKKDHQLVLEEAYRLGNTFIHLCHKNLVLWGLPIVKDKEIIGGAIFGYLLFEQNRPQLSRYQVDFPDLTENNAFISSKAVSSFSKKLIDYFKGENLIDVDLFKISEEKAYIQREIGEKLIENKRKGGNEQHIIYEKQENLMNSIKFCEVDDIRDNLNDVLSEIFLEGIANMSLLKFRMLELFVLISRTMMEAGGNIDEFYHLTTQYAKKTEHLDDIYSFSLWLKEILNDFVSTVILTRKKLGHVNRAINFIRQNLDKKLAIAEVAGFVAMSESRFSQIFRLETGVSFPEYVNSAKIERAKELIGSGTLSLTEIANELNFYDQSYFTKTFRKHAGMTPKQFLNKLKRSLTEHKK